MRRDPSPQFPLPSGHLDERSYRPFQHDTAERPYDEFDSGRHRSSTRWDAQGESYVPFAGDHSGRGYEISGPRVSDLLQPKLVNDIGLQRALQRPKERSHHLHHHHHRSHSAGGGGGRRKETELPAQLQQRPDDSFVPCYYDPGDDNNDDRRGCSMPRTLSVSDGVQASRPMVDVVAAFGRASGSGGSLAAAAVGGAGVTAASEATAVSSSVAKEARRQKTPEAAERAMQTTPPRVQVERGEAEPTTQDRYRGWKPWRHTSTGSAVAEGRWSPMYGTTSFSAIRPSATSSRSRSGLNANPGAVAERILYALLQQNEELSRAVQQHHHHQDRSPGMDQRAEGGESFLMKDTSSTVVVPPSLMQRRPPLRVTSEETSMVLGLLREKDREILQLRCSLAVSYRYAAFAIHRQRQQHAPGVSAASLTAMESRFLGALSGTVKSPEQDAPLLVNRAPPHVHGLPDVPLPLGLPRSVAQVSGVLSMLNVEDMLQKKVPTRILARAWRACFVVVDDRGLAVYRSEEDYRQHAFQCALVVAPFRDMEYFVPSFRDLPMREEELCDAVAVGGGGGQQKQRHRHGGRSSSSTRRFLRTLIGRGKRKGASDASEGHDKSDEELGSQEDGSKPSQRKRFDVYEMQMARIAIEHANDVNYAYFGFIAKQPAAHVGGKVVNPPILFRSQSAQEHVEWAHYFAQCFNRRLYREMFPTALAESYAGTGTKETQTDVEVTEAIEAARAEAATTEESTAAEEREKVAHVVAEVETEVAGVTTTDVALQCSPPQGIDAATNTEEANREWVLSSSSSPVLATTPPPPPPPSSTPPMWSVMERGGGAQAVDSADGDIPQASSEAAVVVVNAGEPQEVPWKELVMELRELLVTKNTEREELQQECDGLRSRVQQLLHESHEMRRLVEDRERLRDQLQDSHVARSAEAQRLHEALESLHAAQESALTAETARQDTASREQQQGARVQALQQEVVQLRQERELLAAELLAVKDGYSEGLRSLARRALGDIDYLHDAYTAEEYLRALHGNDAHPRVEHSDGGASHDSSRDDTPSPQQRRHVQLPSEPPPATSMRQPAAAVAAATNEASRTGATRDCSAKSKKEQHVATDADAVGVAMLLVSFTPQHMAIDGCFTVDEAQARLLRSGPSATQRGRQWVILHHNTGAVFAVTAELQTEAHAPQVEAEAKTTLRAASHRNEPNNALPRRALLRRASSVSTPTVRSSSSRQLRERLLSTNAAAGKPVAREKSRVGQ